MIPTDDKGLVPSAAVRGCVVFGQMDGVRVCAPVANARGCRRNATDVQRKRWHRIRDEQLAGFCFRRRRFFGKYVSDFICLEAKWGIELVGAQHVEQIPGDEIRSTFLRRENLSVPCFWRDEVREGQNGVLERILEKLQGSSRIAPPQTSLLRGRKHNSEVVE